MHKVGTIIRYKNYFGQFSVWHLVKKPSCKWCDSPYSWKALEPMDTPIVGTLRCSALFAGMTSPLVQVLEEGTGEPVEGS